MKTLTALLFAIIFCPASYAQKHRPLIEPLPGLVYADPRLVLKTGYLVVPEDRKKPNGRKVKLPFLFVRRPDQDPRRHISLYMTGGPGYSTTQQIDSISYDSGWLAYGGFIALDQRGTRRALPCLDCQGIDAAIRRSYLEGKDRDRLVSAAARRCRERLVRQGIDLSAFNTVESAEDINDLRLALHLDSLNLVGISYSGSLMLAMARLHPEGVRALVLNSPLPNDVNFEEHALFNINEALEQVFRNCQVDSSAAYQDLRARFHRYFTAITGRRFDLAYRNNKLTYGKNELLEAIIGRLNTWQVKTVPAVMTDLIEGRHGKYVHEVLDKYFAGNVSVAYGMRYSVYCAEQLAYEDPQVEKQQDRVLPWLAGYPYNDVNHPICACWRVRPEPAAAKRPVYSRVPALLSAGDIDPDCRPFYNTLLKRYLPNSQLLIFHNKGHAPGFAIDGTDYVKLFLEDPNRQLVSHSKDLVIH